MPRLVVKIVPELSKVHNVFQKIAQDLQLQQNIEKFAYAVEAESKKVTPVDTGRLRSSIKTQIGHLRASIGPHVEYDIFVHEGTRKMEGRPFLRWGVEEASMKYWGGQPPFKIHIDSIINKNINQL